MRNETSASSSRARENNNVSKQSCVVQGSELIHLGDNVNHHSVKLAYHTAVHERMIKSPVSVTYLL
jgi:hypothetical protein